MDIQKVWGLLRDLASTIFLTALLCHSSIPGRQWIQEHQWPQTMSFHVKQNLIHCLEVEVKNHYWLSLPYLTREPEPSWWPACPRSPSNRYVVDQLDHLNVTKKWS
ncbi:unnamed protein product [Nyctereutes procyonoides]|uniref:(raccoon dog) hypothetical protein n=1 Tax=Nyctereutes procyonoides TaxID=34880 RepID=A0A811YL70_NYCPR|nr:unnamed protein product [Nyctereutes procyonoides]